MAQKFQFFPKLFKPNKVCVSFFIVSKKAFDDPMMTTQSNHSLISISPDCTNICSWTWCWVHSQDDGSWASCCHCRARDSHPGPNLQVFRSTGINFIHALEPHAHKSVAVPTKLSLVNPLRNLVIHREMRLLWQTDK